MTEKGEKEIPPMFSKGNSRESEKSEGPGVDRAREAVSSQ